MSLLSIGPRWKNAADDDRLALDNSDCSLLLIGNMWQDGQCYLELILQITEAEVVFCSEGSAHPQKLGRLIARTGHISLTDALLSI